MTKVSKRLGLTLVNRFGLVDRHDPEPDIVLLPHSLLRAPLDRPYRAIRMIRDPRDIWVSGHLYHRHCQEEWCINTDMDPTPPIAWPKVDHSFAHWPEDWKRRYLERLNGKSYQRNLLERSMVEGLDFELEGYTGCTLAAMREWRLNGADALDVKLEDVMADFDGAMRRIFDHFGFTAEQSEAALEVARSEDVHRMDEATVATRPQIHSRTISKWRNALLPEQVARFEASNAGLILELDYELAGVAPRLPGTMVGDGLFTQAIGPFAAEVDEVDEVRLIWPGSTQTSEPVAPVAAMGRGADVWLSADGAKIRPTVSCRGTYSFVVPPGTERVWLQSRRSAAIDPDASYLGDGRSLGVRVRQIVVRSSARDVVIPADDPRLVTGWHDVEQAGTGPWRWTDGSGELPWAGVAGPAVVIVHGTAVGEDPSRD
jgi:hypothetical protein